MGSFETVRLDVDRCPEHRVLGAVLTGAWRGHSRRDSPKKLLPISGHIVPGISGRWPEMMCA